jgi:hypothetical protein
MGTRRGPEEGGKPIDALHIRDQKNKKVLEKALKSDNLGTTLGELTSAMKDSLKTIADVFTGAKPNRS